MIRVVPSEIDVKIIPEGSSLKPGIPLKILIVTRTQDGKLVDKEVELVITKISKGDVKTEKLKIKTEKGRILGIVPFLGVLKALLGFKNSAPPCGSGVDSVAITTDGKVVACPICADLDWNVLGDLNSDLDKLKKVEIEKPCPNCEYFDICGGRCLFFNKERLWGDEGFRLVCSTVKHLIEEIKKVKPRILELVNKDVIKFEDLIYPKFNNTTEIIP